MNKRIGCGISVVGLLWLCSCASDSGGSNTAGTSGATSTAGNAGAHSSSGGVGGNTSSGGAGATNAGSSTGGTMNSSGAAGTATVQVSCPQQGDADTEEDCPDPELTRKLDCDGDEQLMEAINAGCEEVSPTDLKEDVCCPLTVEGIPDPQSAP